MNVHQTRLDNGLIILTDPMDVPSFTLGVWVDIGSRNESPEINGITHFLEHMLFKGTKRRSALAITTEIENVGGRINAYTTKEHTAYYIQALAEYLPLAIDLLGDMLQQSVFDPQELAREKSVILQEILQGYDTPDDIIFDHFQKTAYPLCPLGQPIIGNPLSVGAVDRQTVLDYFQAYYTPRAMVLAAAGNVDHAAVVECADKAFSAKTSASSKKVTPALYCGGEYRVIQPELRQTQLILGFKGVGVKDDAFYSALVLNVLLGGGMSSRLFQEIRERRGLAYSVHTFVESYQEDGLFGVYAGVGAKDVQELVAAVCEQLALEAITDEEIQRASIQLKSGLLMDLERSSARCRRLGQNMLNFNRIVPLNEVVSKLEAVDRRSVTTVMARLFQSLPTLTILGPVATLEPYEAILDRLP